MLFNLHTGICAICKKNMMIKENKKYLFRLFEESQESQMKEKGVVFRSNSKRNGYYICVECEEKGLASFVCVLCGNERPSSDIQESFGDPPEILCKQCYSTVSAKDWESKVEKLRLAHRYDFE